MKIIFLGAGVIGGSVGAWVAAHHEETYFLDRGPVAEALRQRGLTTYCGDSPAESQTVKVKVIGDLAEVPDPDLIVLGVKNYSLEGVAAMVKEKCGDKPVILSMANGIANQRILPKFFSKVVYCAIAYNGWMNEPGVVGYQKKGPLIIGTPDNSLRPEMEAIAQVFNQGVETIVTDHLQDAVHGKIVINLSNSATTLLGPDYQKIPDRKLLQKLLSGILLEGVQIIRAAGYHECQLGGMPGWNVIWAAAKLPRFITAPLFERNVRKMVLSSMAQDVRAQGGAMTELDSINGYILELADRVKHPAPINRAVYALCRQRFGKGTFVPLTAEEIWQAVEKQKTG